MGGSASRTKTKRQSLLKGYSEAEPWNKGTQKILCHSPPKAPISSCFKAS